METWKIDLSTERELRDYYIAQGKPDIAKSISHTESKYEGYTIDLLTLKELRNMKKLNPDTVVISIFGEEVRAFEMDEDTRAGYVAAGTNPRLLD